MVVKDRVGRRRYVIASNVASLKRVVPELKKLDSSVRIIHMDENFVLVRCRHWYRDDIIKLLNNSGVKTYTTTGTIKKARKIIASLRP